MRAEEMFTTLPANAKRDGFKFRVMKREADGFVHSIGIVVANDKHAADYRAHQYWGKNIPAAERERGAVVWAEEMEDEAA